MCLAFAGCSSDGDDASDSTSTARVVQLGGPGDTSRVLTSDEIADQPDRPAFTDADVAFAQGMIHHHQQALEMAALVDERAERDDLSLLAERLTVSQVDEIALLERWLTERGQEIPGHEGGHGDLMAGMLTDDEMAVLEAARGTQFDMLFLTSMLTHHEGAVTLVQDLFDAGGAIESEMFHLAEGMATDQGVEIARMHEVLAEVMATSSTTQP